MLRNHRFYQDKRLLALEREARSLGWGGMVTIDPPIQRGWVRHWVLAGWTKDHRQRRVFEDILREVNTEQRFSSPTRPQGMRRSRKRMHVTSQGFKRIKAARWKKLNWSGEYKAHFRPVYHVRHNNRFLIHYALNTHHMFELKFERRWIFKLPILEPAKVSRRAEIQCIIGKDGETRLARLHGRRTWWRNRGNSRRDKMEREARADMVRIRQGERDAERRRKQPPPFSVPRHPKSIFTFLLCRKTNTTIVTNNCWRWTGNPALCLKR